VRAQLQELLKQSGACVADLVRLFDDDADGKLLIDDMEFLKAMRTKFGFKGPSWVINEVFESLDTDQSGLIGFDELFEFIRGRPHSLDNRRKRGRRATLEPPAGMSMDTILWTGETLRLLIVDMLSRCGMGANDLFRAWDKDGNRILTREEWNQTMHEWFFCSHHPDLWKNDIAGISDRSFTVVASLKGPELKAAPTARDGKLVDIVRFAKWLNTAGARTEIVSLSHRIQAKSKDFLKRQLGRRRKTDAPVESRKVDATAKAQEGIDAAAQRASERELRARKELSRQVKLWKKSHETHHNGQQWHMPPLQRWETPRELEPSTAAPASRVTSIPSRLSTRTDTVAWKMTFDGSFRSRSPRSLSLPTTPRPPRSQAQTVTGLTKVSSPHSPHLHPRPARMLMLSELK